MAESVEELLSQIPEIPEREGVISRKGRLKVHEIQMTHLNNNCLCALHIETYGDNPLQYGIAQICIWLLDNFIQPTKKIVPFYFDLKVSDPENIDFQTATLTKEKLLDTAINGADIYIAADRLDDWFQRLNLKEGKKIVPLCYNWPATRAYLYQWLGHYNFNAIFDYQYRDILSGALLVNDKKNHMAEPCIYPKTIISYIGNEHNVEISSKTDVMEKCLKIAEIYRLMLINRIN